MAEQIVGRVEAEKAKALAAAEAAKAAAEAAKAAAEAAAAEAAALRQQVEELQAARDYGCSASASKRGRDEQEPAASEQQAKGLRTTSPRTSREKSKPSSEPSGPWRTSPS